MNKAPFNTLPYYFGRFLVRLLGFKGKKSYSFLHEDNVIDWLTGYKDNGIYIDIGAFHPTNLSNTKLFYDRGWHGINIEPNIEGYEFFLKERPRDVNLNRAVGVGEANYWNDGGMGSGETCDEARARKFGMKNKTTVKLKPLKEIFEENGLKMVDFMSIDVEGFEMEVLKSNDWNIYKARVICLEGWGNSYLNEFGYKKIFLDGWNTYYKLI